MESAGDLQPSAASWEHLAVQAAERQVELALLLADGHRDCRALQQRVEELQAEAAKQQQQQEGRQPELAQTAELREQLTAAQQAWACLA